MNRGNSVSVLQAVLVLILCSGFVYSADIGLVGSYFDNQDLTNRKLVRVDSQVDFNWGNGSPAPEIGADTFSVRWEGQVETVGAGEYTFYTSSDDGVRLWVDGVLVIDNWTDHAPTVNSATVTLDAGQRYSIRMEMYEKGGGAVASLAWTTPGQTTQFVIPSTQLHQPAWYVNPPEVTGTSPVNGGGLSVAAPSVSVSFSKPMDKGTVEAAFAMGDVAGSFAWANETLTFTPVTPLQQNAAYTVVIGAGARDTAGNAMAAPYSFTLTTGARSGFVGQYFDQKDLTDPKLARIDPVIGFDWGTGSPDSRIGVDTFSARWTGQMVPVHSETYMLSTVSDDGIRLYVNGELKIDNWTDHAAKEDSCTMDLIAGQKYEIRLEYYENTGYTQAKLFWVSANQAKELISGIAPSSIALPSAPENLHVTHLADRVSVLAWAPPGDGSLVGGYEVFRDGRYLASTSIAEYRDASLTAATTYRYAVRSLGVAGGASALTGELLVTTLPAPAVGTGTGLLARIYDNPDFTTRKVVRVDPNLDFNWGTDAPATGVDPETFSIRWQGQIEPPYSEQYTIYAVSDDGVRVWIDGQAVIDNWTDHSAKEDKCTITLQAGRKYDIRVDYYENIGNATARLLWESLSQPKEVVATTQLYPAEFLTSLDVRLLTGLESPVSPAWVELNCSEDAVAIRFGVNGGAAQDVVRESPEKCFGDTASAQGLPYGIPLDKDNPTSVMVTVDDGAGQTKTTEHALVWKATKLNGKSWSEDEIAIRVNDSLLFTVESETPGAIVKLDVNEDGTIDYEGPAGMKFQWKYTSAGQYTVTAWVGQDECGTLTVTVVDADLKGPIACEIGYQREKFVAVSPAASVGSVSFVANNPGLLGVSVKGPSVESGEQGERLYLKTLGSGTPVLQARLNGTCGPLIKQQEVDEFTLDTQATKFIGAIETFADGSMLVQTNLVLSPRVENLSVTLNIFVSGVTFEDSTLVKTLNTIAFILDPGTGKYLHPYQMIMSPGIQTGSCHTIKVCQRSEQVGQ